MGFVQGILALVLGSAIRRLKYNQCGRDAPWTRKEDLVTRRLLAPLMLILFGGCASQGAFNDLPELETNGELPPDVGVLLVSTGRVNSGWFPKLPFVSYGVYRKAGDGEVEKVAFLPAEAGLANKLGKGKYGFIHVRELQAGSYYLVSSCPKKGNLRAGR